jgi:hypothetical protein
MNITGRPISWYEYYRVIKKLVGKLEGDKKVGMNITGYSKSWNEYYIVIKNLICIFSMLPCYDACNNWLFFNRIFLLTFPKFNHAQNTLLENQYTYHTAFSSIQNSSGTPAK